MAKRIIATLSALILVFGLCSCTKTDKQKPVPDKSLASNSSQSTSEAEKTSASEESSSSETETTEESTAATTTTATTVKKSATATKKPATTTKKPVTTTKKPVTTTKKPSGSSLPALVNDSSFLNSAKSAINAERRKAGVSEMSIDYTMCKLAGVRAKEISKNQSHTRPDGRKYNTIYADYGVTKPKATGENIAWATSFDSARDIVNYWMESTMGHREVMLNGKYKRFGIAMIRSGGKDYAVLMLAN
ncbi:MAG: CAP domain-containing protein [Oscillospiraceae bacterium]|nr:CAP domain-containing protein [Oscillospiraceae bacterium]